MKSSLIQRIRTWARGRTGRFLLTQLTHTAITVIALAALLLGAARVGALNGVLAPAAASVADTSFTSINYQGRLADSGGAPIDNTNPGLGITFALYDADSGGSPVWTETHASVPVSEGLFSVRLGSINALSTDLLTGDRWMGIQVGADPEMEPREKLAVVPYAMQSGLALEVPVGSVSSNKLNLDANVDVHGHSFTSVDSVENNGNLIAPASGSTPAVRLISKNSAHIFIDSDNDQTDRKFSVLANSGAFVSPAKELMTIDEDGNLWVRGSVTHGALIEANLQTSEESAADYIDRFSEGGVLCWDVDRLELCAQAGDPLVQAVADENGKPIVLGAEPVKVLGVVQAGDLLVASDVPGYAMVDNNPRLGTVIAQALESFAGEQGVIKAMIRKF